MLVPAEVLRPARQRDAAADTLAPEYDRCSGVCIEEREERNEILLDAALRGAARRRPISTVGGDEEGVSCGAAGGGGGEDCGEVGESWRGRGGIAVRLVLAG